MKPKDVAIAIQSVWKLKSIDVDFWVQDNVTVILLWPATHTAEDMMNMIYIYDLI